MTAYYNEIDPYAAEWLRKLIGAGLIALGEVDERSIEDVRSGDLKGFTQCHFFAGIGGWSHALRLAMWPDDRPVWTGSCPCQPFSSAGKQNGQADARHLWPVWFRLIRECRPAIVFGEQVARAIAHGWLDEVAHDMEGEGYAIGSAVLPACSVGAPHKRDRLWFVGHSEGHGRGQGYQDASRSNERGHAEQGAGFTRAGVGPMANALGIGGCGGNCERQDAEHVDAPSEECSRHGGDDDLEWIAGPDGKARPVKPGIRLLAHGVLNRVGKLRAYGNAIVPQVAAEFITAYREAVNV